jgi:ribosomal protein S15P/S13E
MPKKKQEKSDEKGEDKKKSEKISQESFEKKVLELAETGLTAEKIGEKLRKEGIHPAEFSKKISKVLGSKYTNPDTKNIQEKLKKLEEHYKKNKGDRRAMRDKERVAAKLRRLGKYLNK